MTKHSSWLETVAQVVYEAYPDHDLLPIEPPRSGETIGELAARAENAGDTLFLFLCREADDDIDTPEYVARLDRAIRDIEAVKAAVQNNSHPGLGEEAEIADAGKAKPPVAIKLLLNDDWIELLLTYADRHGRRSGSVSSSLHSSEKDDCCLNAAMDAVESIVLAHACAGIDVTDARYVGGIRTCVQACANSM